MKRPTNRSRTASRRQVRELRKARTVRSTFEKLEPRQMLDGSGTAVAGPPELPFSYLGLPWEASSLVEALQENPSQFRESTLEFPHTQENPDPEGEAIDNIFQMKAVSISALTLPARVINSGATAGDGSHKDVQLRELDENNTLVLFRQVDVTTTWSAGSSGSGGGGGLGGGLGGGSEPAYESRSTEAWFHALVTDSAQAAQIESSQTLGPLAPSLVLFTLHVDHDFGYSRSTSGSNTDFALNNSLAYTLDIDWNSDVTLPYDLGEEYTEPGSLRVITDTTLTMSQSQSGTFSGQIVGGGGYSLNSPWSKSGSGATTRSASSNSQWVLAYLEGTIDPNDGLPDDGEQLLFSVTDNFSTSGTAGFSYVGNGTYMGDSLDGYQYHTRNESLTRTGNSVTTDAPVETFEYRSVGAEDEPVEEDNDEGDGGGNTPAPMQNVFQDITFESTFSPVYNGNHDYTTHWTSVRQGSGEWAETLVTSEVHDFDTTGTHYEDTADILSITTREHFGMRLYQVADFSSESAAETVVTTSASMLFSGSTTQAMVTTGTVDVDTAVTVLDTGSTTNSSVLIETAMVSGEVSEGIFATLPANWLDILRSPGFPSDPQVDWTWLGGGQFIGTVMSMGDQGTSTLVNAQVNQYGSRVEFLADKSMEFTNTADTSYLSGWADNSTSNLKSLFYDAPDPGEDEAVSVFNWTVDNDATWFSGSFSANDGQNVTVLATPVWSDPSDPGNNSGRPQILRYDPDTTGTTVRHVASNSTYANQSSGTISNLNLSDDYSGNRTEIAFQHASQQESTTTSGFTSASATTFGGSAETFLTTVTAAAGSSSKNMPVDNYAITTLSDVRTEDPEANTTHKRLYAYRPWIGGGTFGVVWNQNTTLVLTEAGCDGEGGEGEPGSGEEEPACLDATFAGDINVWTTDDSEHDLDGDNAALETLYEVTRMGLPGNAVPGTTGSFRDVSNADQKSGNRNYTNNMHTRRVFHDGGVDLITNGTEQVNWNNSIRMPVDIRDEDFQDEGTGIIVETEITEEGFEKYGLVGKIETTADDWTVSIRDTETPEESAASTPPLSGNQIYNQPGSDVRVTGTLTTVEDLKETFEYRTTMDTEKTQTGQNLPAGTTVKGRVWDVLETDIDGSERSIRTTTLTGTYTPSGSPGEPDTSSLSEVITLALSAADNRTDYSYVRNGGTEFDAAGPLENGTGWQATVVRMLHSNNDTGFGMNQVVDGSGTVTSTRGADGNVVVTGTMIAERVWTGNATAEGTARHVDGIRFNSTSSPANEAELTSLADDMLGHAAGGPGGNPTDPYMGFDRFAAGEVLSREIDADYEETERYEWIRTPKDANLDGVFESYEDVGPIVTFTSSVTGTDERELHSWGIDEIGPYDESWSERTVIEDQPVPAAWLDKAFSYRGEYAPKDRPVESGGGGGNELPPVDDSNSNYASGGGVQEEGNSGSGGGTVDGDGNILLGREVPTGWGSPRRGLPDFPGLGFQGVNIPKLFFDKNWDLIDEASKIAEKLAILEAKIAELEWALQMAHLAAASYEDSELSEFAKNSGWQELEDFHDKSGFHARLFVNQFSGQVVFGMAGTTFNSLGDWRANVGQNFGYESEQYELTIVLANHYRQRFGDDIILVGHSLGGGLASAAAMVLGLDSVTFNSSGVNWLTVTRHGVSFDWWIAERLITSYRIDWDILSVSQIIFGSLTDGVGGDRWLDPATLNHPLALHKMENVIAAIESEIGELRNEGYELLGPMIDRYRNF